MLNASGICPGHLILHLFPKTVNHNLLISLNHFSGGAPMDVGYFMIFSNYGWDGQPDGVTWKEELKLADIAADLGFDCLWSADHHFADYSFVPENLQLMSHLAVE